MDNISIIEIILGLFVFLILLTIFWLPTIIAFKNQKDNRVYVGILNLVFGATGIGWLLLIIWVFRDDSNRNRMNRSLIR